MREGPRTGGQRWGWESRRLAAEGVTGWLEPSVCSRFHSDGSVEAANAVNVEHVLMEPMVMGHSRSPCPFSTPPTVKHFASVVSPVTQRSLFPTKLCCLGSSRSARSDLGRLDTEKAGRVPSVGLGAGQERSDVRAVVLGTFLWFSQ